LKRLSCKAITSNQQVCLSHQTIWRVKEYSEPIVNQKQVFFKNQHQIPFNQIPRSPFSRYLKLLKLKMFKILRASMMIKTPKDATKNPDLTHKF